MGREEISDKQGIVLVTMFIMGSSLVIGIGAEAGKDSWMSIIFGIILSFPVLMMYARILSLFPKKNMFDVIEIVLGKFLGKIVLIMYIWFSFHLGALVLRNFGEFINSVSIPETPEIVPMTFIVLLCAYGVKSGIEVLSRWSRLALLILVSLITLSIFLLIPDMELNNIRPLLSKGIMPVLTGAFSVFSFPFAETILFALVFSGLQNKKSPYKIYTYAIVLGGLVLFATNITELMVLGEIQFTSTYFPSYTTVRRTTVGDFIQRSEIIVSITFLGAGFIKISICLLAACKGIAKLFNSKEYRFIVTPISLLMVCLAYLVYDSLMEMTEWAFSIWRYYAFVFQVILPVIIWIGAEIKHKMLKG